MQKRIKIPASASDCAAHLLEVVPAVMRAIRGQMRSHSAAELSVVQFRALAFLNRRAGASLSDLAEHIGLSLPTVSKLVQKLVKRGYLRRQFDTGDRRRNILTPTAKGGQILVAARKATRAHLADLLQKLSREERDAVNHATRALRPIFLADVVTHGNANGHSRKSNSKT